MVRFPSWPADHAVVGGALMAQWIAGLMVAMCIGLLIGNAAGARIERTSIAKECRVVGAFMSGSKGYQCHVL